MSPDGEVCKKHNDITEDNQTCCDTLAMEQKVCNQSIVLHSGICCAILMMLYNSLY